jgi:SAM-dependent methyltransferase
MNARDSNTVSSKSAPDTHADMLRLITGKWVSQAIGAVTELGIPDLVSAKAQTATELARATHANTDSLYRVLRALSAQGIFFEEENGEFRNTPLSATLCRDVQGSLRLPVQFEGMDITWKAWGELLYSIRTGESAFERAAGEPLYAYFNSNRRESEILNAATTAISKVESDAIIQAYDFSSASVIVDVGGGEGHLLANILRNNPRAHGVLVELAHAAVGARRLFSDWGLADRTEVVVGDALHSVSAGGDIYLMKRVVHNWDDDRSIRLMKNCAAAMTPGGKLLIVEMVVSHRNEQDFSKLMDLQMMVMTQGGRERTEEEYRSLYSAAGLEMRDIYRTPEAVSVIEGVPQRRR